MFLTELTPLLREASQQPIAFLGGLASGFLRLSLAEDPVKSWLDKQTGTSGTSYAAPNHGQNGNGSGPQSISID